MHECVRACFYYDNEQAFRCLFVSVHVSFFGLFLLIDLCFFCLRFFVSIFVQACVHSCVRASVRSCLRACGSLRCFLASV